jgi:hypothetical protein
MNKKYLFVCRAYSYLLNAQHFIFELCIKPGYGLDYQLVNFGNAKAGSKWMEFSFGGY